MNPSGVMLRRVVLVARVAATVTALVRLARAGRRRPPLESASTASASTASASTAPASTTPAVPTISVVVPARNEAERIGPLLDALLGAGAASAAVLPAAVEVIVVDDESTDAPAAVAAAAGARVVTGAPLPPHWAGKAWALQQGVEAATGDWVVTLDADTRPSPHLPRAMVARAVADGLEFVSVGGRFECPTAGAAWLHPALLTTLVYRFGPSGYAGPIRADRQLANGQCMAFPRCAFLAAGGFLPVARHVVEDVALVRHLADTGWRVAMLDGSSLLNTRMFDDFGHTWRGWSRSIALPGVERRRWQVVDLAVLLVTQASPLPRLLLRRADALDLVLLAARLGTMVGTADAYEHRTVAYWASPLADVPAVAAVATGVVRSLLGRGHRWRGRTYP